MAMTSRAAFLNTAFSAYHHREGPPEDQELARVGPGTPCGEYLRRFWQPVVLSEELRDLPKRLRILGEDLVAFRDKSGAVGLLETPGEPADSTLKDRLFHGAYPVQEYHGLVFAYMGPPDAQPDFPILDTYDVPGYQLVARQGTVWPCNWLQVKDNSMDPAHLAFLHTLPGSQGFTDDLGALGEWDWMETPVGMVYIDTRRQGDRVWVRVADFILPNIHQFPPNADPMALRTTINRPAATTWAVPLDDTHTMQIGFRRAPEGREMRPGNGFGQDGNRSYEERQRVPGDYDAQISIHSGMARHGLEHLAATDRGVIVMRNLIRRGIRATQDGTGPAHDRRNSPSNGEAIATFSHDRVVPGIPPAATPEEDRRLLREIARKVVTDAVERGSVTA
jgi:hypothetical protein